ncbi:hypothetical protein K457DRAFT_36816 [Linnemannia elongata AG-77]|uniref:F-box domain-containing protein n=1 Tax=Linnemannia elongata AG-77 TaxID=1314771 RepID=A0A197JDH8_9FUNG|nr:hypothetical protein K457DRAFT_36816 [Linnemannia elongata AG-77]
MEQEQVAATRTSFKDLPPEIQSMIGQFLNPYDMTVCVRVCQAWKVLFIPYIWRHVKSSESMNWSSMEYVLWRCIDDPLYGLREPAYLVDDDLLGLMPTIHYFTPTATNPDREISAGDGFRYIWTGIDAHSVAAGWLQIHQQQGYTTVLVYGA